jgi:hypothetical protein
MHYTLMPWGKRLQYCVARYNALGLRDRGDSVRVLLTITINTGGLRAAPLYL